MAEAIKKGPGCGNVEAVEGGDVVTQSRYDDLNRLGETVDAAGNKVVYDYYAGGQLFSISKDIDAEPNSVELLVTQKNYYDDARQEDVVFDAAGNYLVKSYDSLGRVLVEWAYDGKGTADYGDDVAARQIRYSYDNSEKVLRKAIIANAGQELNIAIDCAVDNVTDYDYDGLGRLSAKTTYYGGGDLLTAVSSYEYDGLGRLTASVDPAGNETVNAYDALGRVVLVEKNYASGTDSLTVTTERLHDGLGRLSEVRRIPEATVPGEYLATVYEYDVRDNLERITDPNGTITVFGYDGLGRQVLKIADYGSGRINQTTEFGYDRLGRQIYVSAWPDETNPTGVQTTTYQYDNLNRLTLVTYPNDSECGYSYDVLGRTIERRDRREWLTEYEYDNLGRLTQRKSYDGQNELIATETFCYDALGNLLNIAKIADGKNISSSVFTYNSLSLITSETTALFDESAVIAQYDYDQAGLLVGQSGGGGGESINYSREALGRINTITRDNGVEPPCPIAAYTYLGPHTQEIYFDNAGLTQTLSYNNLEQIIGIANVPADSDETLEYHYEYDRAGNRIEIEYTHLSPVKYDLFGYDRLGRLRKAQYGVSDSLVMREVKGLGPLPREFGGLDGLEWAGTAAEIWLINEFLADVGVKEYSKLDGQHSIDEILRLKFRDENWNRMLRNVLHDHRPMVRALELGADFDRKESRSEKLIDKFGNIHEFIIQTQTGRLLTWIITSENQKSESFVHAEVFYYDKRRQTLFRVNFGNGSYIDMHLKYNQKGQMTAQTNKEYDRAGNLKKTWQVPVAEVELQTFSASSSEIYLLSVPIPEALSELVESFSYDDLSNRVNHQLGGESPLNDTYTINNLNQYTQITHSDDSYHTCDYDPAGNLRRDMNDYHYYYDEESRLVEIRGADDLTMVAAYDYDGLGRRVRRLRRMPGGEVEESLYYYDNRERVIAEYEKAASEDDFEISRCFVYGNNIDEALAMYEPGNAAEGDESDLLLLIGLGESWLCDANDADFDGDFDYDDSNFVDLRDFVYLSQGWSYVPAREEKRWYYLKDALGSVVGLVGSHEGAESEFYHYDAFGNACEVSAVGNPYMFTGRRLDVLDSGNLLRQYNRRRYYDSQLGRWLGPDPAGYIDGLNLYVYVGNNPVIYVDPDGRMLGLETVWDIASVIYDTGKITVGIVTDNPTLVIDGYADLVCDVVALAIPGMPAGYTKLTRMTGKAGRGARTILTNGTEVAIRIRKSRRKLRTLTPAAEAGQELTRKFILAVDDKVATNFLTKVRAGKCTVTAEIDTFMSSRAVYELKAWKEISPSHANRIVEQVSRQRQVLETMQGRHLGLIVEDYTKMSNQTMDILYQNDINITRISEFVEAQANVNINVSR